MLKIKTGIIKNTIFMMPKVFVYNLNEILSCGCKQSSL